MNLLVDFAKKYLVIEACFSRLKNLKRDCLNKVVNIWNAKRHFEKKNSGMYKVPGKGKGCRRIFLTKEEFMEQKFSFVPLTKTTTEMPAAEEEEEQGLPDNFSQGSDISSG